MKVLELEDWAFKIESDKMKVFYNKSWREKEKDFEYIGTMLREDIEKLKKFLQEVVSTSKEARE
ncbi:MAG: hypothetical protein ACTSYD_02270 [Candidatus Heimdallarchaeaceae archaeon]